MSDVLYPLTIFRQGGVMPSTTLVEEAGVPQPYRGLLVHGGDMTSRLEDHHRDNMALDVLRLENTDAGYRREVVLRTERGRKAVEYGAIEIFLGAFDLELQTRILEGRQPLGGLLNEYDINYRSVPRGYFRMEADAALADIFSVPAGQHLWGRSNQLLGEADKLLARIVEVLRP